MYNLNIEGFGSIPVGEEFLRLSPADQEAYVRRVVAERQGQQINVDQRGLGQNAGTLDRGVANIQQGVATTARRLGEAGVFPETMGAVADAVAPDPQRLQGQSAAGAMSENFLGNLDLIPRGVMEVLPSLGGVWASVKVGGAIGGPIGALGGGIAYTLATALGPYAEEAARNNGRTTPNREDWTRGAAAAAAEGIFERIGVRGLGRGIVGGSVREGGTELAGSQAANAVTSVGTEAGYQVPTGSELATEFTLGAGAAGTVNTAAATARVPGRVATAATQAIADVPRAREVAQYTDEQLVSDLRVVEAYNRRREAERGTERFGTTNSNPDPSVTFKGVMDDYERSLRALIDAEYAAGSLTREQRDTLRQEVYSAKRHNRELADNTAGLDYFESQREAIRNMGLNPAVEGVLLDGMRDLNTATYNAMFKNRTGPFARIGQRLGIAAGGAAGFTQAGPAGILLGAATGGIGKALGAGLDRAAGLSQPEALARARVLAREGQRRKLDVDPIAPEIQNLTQDALARAQTNATTQASQMAQYNAMANQMGLARGGGWAMSVAQQANGFAPGTVDIEDPVRAVEDLARAGVLDPQRAQTLINDRTARPTEPEMRLITDYVVSAASQTNREAWNARPGTQASATSRGAPSGLPDPPVARVGNPVAYDAKMAQVNALNDAVRATATDPQARATAENVMGAKSKADKEAAFGQGTGDPAVDALLRATIAMTSARSRDPATGVSGSSTGGGNGPPSGTRARSGGFQAVQDPTRRTTQRGGLQVDPFTGNQGRTETGRAAPGARNAVDPGRASGASTTGAPQKTTKKKAALTVEPTAATDLDADALERGNQVTNEDFLRILRDNPGADTLTQYDPVELQQDVASGKMRLFKAPGHDAVFAIKTENYASDYGATHPALQGDHKVLVAVANNDPQNLKKWGEAAARLAHEQGVTALDAYAVTTSDAPEGFLPRIYGLSGFRVVETLPYNRDFLGNTEQERATKEAALEQYWRTLGWEPSRGYPPLAIMVHESALGPLTTQEAEASLKSMVDPAMMKRSLVGDLYGPDGIQRKGDLKVRKIGETLQSRGQDDKLGVLSDYSAKNREKIARLMAYEAFKAIQGDNSAIGWYDEKVRETLAMASAKYPELATDAEAALAMTFAMAVTSNGTAVDTNMANAMRVYEQWRDGGKAMPDFGTGKAASAMKNSFKLWNQWVSKHGVKDFSDFLFRQTTVGELNALMEKLGIDLEIAGENKDTPVFGAAVLGPKIGNGFFMNLNGRFDQLTMDMWWMRMWGRMTGDLVPVVSEKTRLARRSRLEEAILAEGVKGLSRYDNLPDGFRPTKAYLKRLSDEQLLDVSEAIESWASRNDWDRTGPLDPKTKKNKPSEVSSAAKRWNEGFNELNEQPVSGGHRNFMRSTAQRAMEILRKHGITISAADFQAVLWYPEQRLYQQVFGKGRGTDTDYAQSIRSILLKGGISEKDLDAAKTRGFDYKRL